MMKFVSLLFASNWAIGSLGFSSRFAQNSFSFGLFSSTIPSLDELSSEPFIKQVGYGQKIVFMLENTEKESVSDESLTEMICAQLSHSDGIRGFFVSYLTGGNVISEIPVPLKNAIQHIDKKELIPLACMNVIMPTAMVTLHTDRDLSDSSKATAAKGIVVAKFLMKEEHMKENCMAIIGAITLDTTCCDPKLVEYWTDFYAKWGYKDEQKRDILHAFEELMTEP